MADPKLAEGDGSWRRAAPKLENSESKSLPVDPIEAIRHNWLDDDIDQCGGDSVCEQAMGNIETLYAEIVRLRAIVGDKESPTP